MYIIPGLNIYMGPDGDGWGGTQGREEGVVGTRRSGQGVSRKRADTRDGPFESSVNNGTRGRVVSPESPLRKAVE